MAAMESVFEKTQTSEGEMVRVRLNKKHLNTTEKVAAVIRDLTEQKFTGYLKLNFSQGTIARVEKFEEILK